MNFMTSLPTGNVPLVSNKYYAGIGSRETPKHIQQMMTYFAANMARLSTKEANWVLRSGHAKGADQAFEKGAKSKEIFLPWDGFMGIRADNNVYFSLDDPRAVVLAQKFHPAWHRCTDTARKMHARNMHQILGPNLDRPAEFVVCWTADGKASGGTGQAIRAAEAFKIPVFNLFNHQDMINLIDLLQDQYNLTPGVKQ